MEEWEKNRIQKKTSPHMDVSCRRKVAQQRSEEVVLQPVMLDPLYSHIKRELKIKFYRYLTAPKVVVGKKFFKTKQKKRVGGKIKKKNK